MFFISYFIAFLGGALSLLPACGPALLPGFFALTFKTRASLIKAVLLFALGFSLIFLPFSLGFAFFLNLLIDSRDTIYKIVGVLLMGAGVWALFEYRPQVSVTGSAVSRFQKYEIFGMGLLFGMTSASCSAPIYGAITSIASASGEFFKTLALLLWFEVGLFLPLLALAYFFSRSGMIFLQKLSRPFKAIGKGGIRLIFSISNLLSFTLFFGLGLMFILIRGEPFAVISERLGLVDFFYKTNQDLLRLSFSNNSLDLWFLLGIVLIAGCLIALNLDKKT